MVSVSKMDNSIKICSLNCRGLRNNRKRRDMFKFLREKKYSVYCLQDIHWDNKWQNMIRAEWGYECWYAGYTSNSRGVAILFNNNFEFKVTNVQRDVNGNWLSLSLKIDAIDITLICLYGPNRDDPEFYSRIKELIEQYDNPFCMLCGDWNLVQNPATDTYNYVNVNNPNARNTVLTIMNDLNLVDPWTTLNPDTVRYTWRRQNPFQQARLDFFLISSELLNITESSEINPGYRTDHSMVVISLKQEIITPGKGSWKFNNSLLQDPDYLALVRKCISNVKHLYAATPYSPENINNINAHDFELLIDDQLFFEMLLMEIRGETISYAVKCKKDRLKKDKDLQEKIKILEEEIQQNQSRSDNNDEIKDLLSSLKERNSELENLRNKQLNGTFIRSKARWIEDGEKPTKYFLNLEKRHFVNKQMRKIQRNDGSVVFKQDEIMNEVVNFYKNLYSHKDIVKDIPNNLLCKQLTDNQMNGIAGKITIIELTTSLKNMKNGKSPGPDGFTVEFYKCFWNDLSIFLLRSTNAAFEAGSMIKHRKVGNIILLPKGNKPRQFLRNWRPISLLNVSYKLASAAIANRIKTVLPILVSDDQTGFVPGRYIGENIRLIYDLLQFTDLNSLNGMLLLIDFEKAFDTVSHEFIQKTLQLFNFGPDIINWFNVFYSDMTSSVIVNGHISKSFQIDRGCRQGDPLSPYFFVLCAEVLAVMIRNNKDIKGITIDDEEFKISQYADDTTLILDGSQQSLEGVMETLDDFKKMSGLGINTEKTAAVWIGNSKNNTNPICPHLPLDWHFNGQFNMLGVTFSTDINSMVDINYENVLSLIRQLIQIWSKRSLTVLGRVTVVKSLLLAKLNYFGQMLPNPSADYLKTLNDLIFKFVWDGKPDKIKRSQMIQDYDLGGVKLPHVLTHLNALKVSWVRRVEAGNQKWVKLFHILSKLTKYDILQFGVNRFNNIKQTINNDFWYDVLHAWSIITNITVSDPDMDFNVIARNYLWWNDKIIVGNNSINYKHWKDKGIIFINDLLNDKGKLYNLHELQTTYGLNINFLEYQGIVTCLKTVWKCIGCRNRLDTPFQPTSRDILCKFQKGCKNFYHILLRQVTQSVSSSNKWENRLQIAIGSNDWRNICHRPFIITNDIKIQWFQYRIINSIIATNSLLYKMKIKPDELCTFCQESTETIHHLFCKCKHVITFWRRIETLFSENNVVLYGNQKLSDYMILLGLENNHVVNMILLLAKFHIYRSRVQNGKPNYATFIIELKRYISILKYTAISNMKIDVFDNTWGVWKFELDQHI